MKRPTYQRTPKQYARLYNVSLAAISRWLRRGWPLDDPEALGRCLTPDGQAKSEADPVVPRWRDVPAREW